MNDKYNILIAKIKKRRLSLNMTQKETAAKCGLTQSNYSRFESGSQLPSLETLAGILNALNMTFDVMPQDQTVYHIMYLNEIVAIVKLSLDKKHIEYTKVKEDGVYQPFSGDKLDLERFYRFIKSRCYEDNRADISNILKIMNLKSNNPYEVIEITHGVTFEDFFWIKKDYENLKWEDVKVR